MRANGGGRSRAPQGYFIQVQVQTIMIGDNVVLRPPRLSKDSTPITFAVRVAQLMRWVFKTEVHTHRGHIHPIQLRRWNTTVESDQTGRSRVAMMRQH